MKLVLPYQFVRLPDVGSRLSTSQGSMAPVVRMAADKGRPARIRLMVLLGLFQFMGSATAATVHYWRFEDSPGFLADSVGSATLVDASVSGPAQQVILPAAGRGSSWQLDVGNNKGLDVAATDVLNASTSLSGDFTIEVFANADSLGSLNGNTLAGFGLSRFNYAIGWLFSIRDGFFSLMLFDGSFSYNIVSSGIAPVVGKDYYAAAALDLAGGQATFYIQNLTDGDPLQIVTAAHTMTTYNAIDTFSIGAAASGEMGFDGLIDEVRLSNQALAQGDLLVNDMIPEIGIGPLVVLGLMALASRRR